MEGVQEELRERCRIVSLGITMGGTARVTRKPKALNIYERCLEKAKKRRDRK